MQVLGVGPDGHIGFNEPGEVLYDTAHKEVLDESTIDANARFFATRDEVPAMPSRWAWATSCAPGAC